MPRAVKVLHEKIRTADGVVVEFRVWKVPKSVDYPEGVKYSFLRLSPAWFSSDTITMDQRVITGILPEKGRTISTDSICFGGISQGILGWLRRGERWH